MENTKKYGRSLSMEEILEAERQIQKVFDEFVELYLPRVTKRVTRLSEVADSPPGEEETNEVEQIVTDEVTSPDVEPLFQRRPSPVVREETGTGVSEKKLHAVAMEIARIGDELVTKHGEKVQTMEISLTRLITDSAASASYDTFCNAMERVVGEEKTWTNFMVAMCLSKRVLTHTSNAGSALANNFRRYLGTYNTAVAESGGMANFVREQPRAMTQ